MVTRLLGRIVVGSALILGGYTCGTHHEKKHYETETFKVGIENGLPNVTMKQDGKTYVVNTYQGRPLVEDFSYNIGLLQDALSRSGIQYNTSSPGSSGSAAMNLNALLDKN